MTSEAAEGRAYVWTWLPGQVVPVVAGVLQQTEQSLRGEPILAFRYAASYRGRADAISLWSHELPLDDRVHDPSRTGREPLTLASCLRDASPDAWGRRVLNLRLTGAAGTEPSELTTLLASGSDRIGALDFQHSPTDFVSRDEPATLEQVLSMAELVEAGQPIPPTLAAAVQHGTSIGGARPKALLTAPDGRPLIAKFSSTSDTRPVVKAEGLAMLLARRVGIAVPDVHVERAQGKDVLLVERFDRIRVEGGWARRSMLSMLTVLGETEHGSRHRSYGDIAESIRTDAWTDVAGSLREMFTRLVFNILIGNTDDHLRNHAAFWDGQALTLTPAFDLCPQVRNTEPAGHAIAIVGEQRASQVRLAREAAHFFHLTARDAEDIIDTMTDGIATHWDECCDLARLSSGERSTLWGREFMNPYVGYDEP